MTVLVQRLVPADAAGVAFSANSVIGERNEVVEVVPVNPIPVGVFETDSRLSDSDICASADRFTTTDANQTGIYSLYIEVKHVWRESK